MTTVQARLPDKLVEDLDNLVKEGKYSSRSDVIKDAIRRLISRNNLEKYVGIIPNTGDSVKEVREIRKKLSKELRNYEDFKKVEDELRY